MAVVTLKSPSITNLDANPIVANVIGEGAPGFRRVINDSLNAGSGDSTVSLYRICRIPTNAKVKRVILDSNVANAGAGDIDVCFSDAPGDGTQPSLTGIVQLNTGDNKLFGSAQSLTAIARTEKTLSGAFQLAHMNLPLWQVLVNLGATQFTADPGGFFDLAIRVTTTISNGSSLGLECDYVE